MSDPSPEIIDLARRCHLATGSEELQDILAKAFAELCAERDRFLMFYLSAGECLSLIEELDELRAENERLRAVVEDVKPLNFRIRQILAGVPDAPEGDH